MRKEKDLWVKKDIDEAINYYKKSAEKGNNTALCRLGVLCITENVDGLQYVGQNI